MNLVPRHQRSLQEMLLALAFALAVCLPLGGEIISPQSQKPILHVDVELQSVEVQVKDTRGSDVLGLTAEDFTVLENGKPQKIAFFSAGNGLVSLVVLLDSSSSMISRGRLGSAQAIAAQFMRTAHPGDDISAMDFTDQMGVFQRMSREELLNPSGLTLSHAPSSGAALYDAIATALCHLRTSKNVRQAVIVVTDGDDQHSRITLEQLIGLVRSSRAQLFMIGLPSRPDFNFEGRSEPKITLITGHDIDNPVIVFDRLMKESGAESIIPNSQRDLDEALKAVSNIIKSEYTLAYYPQKSSKRFRKIEVRVDRQGAHATARRYVGSDQDVEESVQFDQTTCIVSPKFHPYAFESKVTPDTGGMVYREDFSDTRSGWPNHKDSHYIANAYELSNNKVAIGNSGQLIASGLSTETPTPTATFRDNRIAAYGPWLSDLRASAAMDAVLETVSHEAGTKFLHKSRPAAGLIFRLNPSGYYALLVSGAADWKTLSFELVRREFDGDSYTETEIIPWTKIAARSSTSGLELSVEAIGNQLSIVVDGQEMKGARDDKFDQGLVGFVISGPGRATFRNLVVEHK
jgi:Ca-activated chloride channel homolog